MLNAIQRRRRGFTLVELLVVLLILGILIAIAVPVYTSTMENAKRSTCEANQRIIRGAIQMFYASEGAWPTDNDFGDTGLEPYLETSPPDCPSEGDYSFSVDTGTGVITVGCDVDGH